jgi:transcriptional regulator with XRE-family HTH domain
MTGPALRALRLAKGLSITGAAKLLGVSRTHLAGLESGAKRITYAVELRAREALGAPHGAPHVAATSVPDGLTGRVLSAHIRRMSVNAQERLAIASRAKISPDTVARYYAGKRVNAGNAALIEMACKRLKLPTRDQIAAHQQDPRTFDGEG